MMAQGLDLENFVCTGCGDCCRWPGSVRLTGRDITRLADRLGLPEEQFIEAHTHLAPNRAGLALIDRPDGSCRFLEENRCSVYEARPEQCRDFPYGWRVEEGCPALDMLTRGEKTVEQSGGKS